MLPDGALRGLKFTLGRVHSIRRRNRVALSSRLECIFKGGAKMATDLGHMRCEVGSHFVWQTHLHMRFAPR